MKVDLHLLFPGTCREAFAFYEQTFGVNTEAMMTFGDAPPGAPKPEGSDHLVLHAAIKLGGVVLMGADTPPGHEQALGGFQVAVNVEDEAKVKRLFAALSQGGTVQMPLAEVFWSPLFGMCTDKFGVGWMVGIPGPEQ